MKMNEMTLTGLLNYGTSHFAKHDAQWLIIEVEVEGNAPEIIINPKENFKAKLAYYQKAYNEDLTLKANPSIKIIRYDFVGAISDYFIFD
jgi:hypothetical protein